VIFDPLRTNCLPQAARRRDAHDKRMRCASRLGVEGAVIATGFAPRERARAPAQLDCIRVLLEQAEDIRRGGSAALDLAYVACGRSTPTSSRRETLDIAAGVLLVREAGGHVCDFKGGGEDLID